MVNKSDIVKEVAEKTGHSVSTVTADFSAIVDVVVAHVAKGERVNVHGIGVFSSAYRAERNYYNYREKRIKVLPAHVTPTFRASKRLKNAVK